MACGSFRREDRADLAARNRYSPLLVPLPRNFPGWPESPEGSVNVLCEGPSLALLEPANLLHGPVVAVNRALAVSSEVPIDCWATVDQPSNLWEWARPHLGADQALFTVYNHVGFWEDAIGHDGINSRLYAWPPTFMGPTETDEGFHDDRGRPPLVPTLFHVLAWLSSLVGTKRVRLFGCDMRGSGSGESFSEAMDMGWVFRWRVERRMLALSTRHCRARGQRIERWAKKE
jgi:hypothetical protein